MSNSQPRLRMFAGPNGSGKSSLKFDLPPRLLGVYLNADDIEQCVRRQGWIDLGAYGIQTSQQEIKLFFALSRLVKSQGIDDGVERLCYVNGRLDFGGILMNSYWASVLVDFLRHRLLEQKISFTFETVMSHASKVEFLLEARQAGYRTYLYYVATEDPSINVSRVKNRVRLGGHDVPPDKVVDRYHRSLRLLPKAVACSNRAYIFDSSNENVGRSREWVAEITEGSLIELKTDKIPGWFRRAVLEKAALVVDGG